ncbi:hypothetical protein EYF80_044562 [Liparis tanakae]|uniref:Uncharacterized protein n=1 Tax=Liparis tanakae TaxID=230148 RepID=A0A4Z2FVH6_9TELE|nr:hypothetical protein EYF80_044562 [Liparis tanakae]
MITGQTCSVRHQAGRKRYDDQLLIANSPLPYTRRPAQSRKHSQLHRGAYQSGHRYHNTIENQHNTI